MKRLIYIILVFLLCVPVFAQDTSLVLKKGQNNSINSAASKLSKSLKESKSDTEVAESYLVLAKEFVSKRDFTKANDYYERALKIFVKEKKSERAAFTNREMAKAAEAKGDIAEASIRYNEAAKQTKDRTIRQINLNDANRLKNVSNPAAQSVLIQSNIDLLSDESAKSVSKEERSIAYSQMAKSKLQQNKASEAEAAFEVAMVDVKGDKEAETRVKKEMASAYYDEDNLEKAIPIQEEIVKDAKKSDNKQEAITQLQNISENYFEINDAEKGVESLKEAYQLAIETGRTIEAKKSLVMLANYYIKNKNPELALELYSDFLGRLDNLVEQDTTIINDQFFKVQEEKILRLETERELTAEMLKRQNTFNYILLLAVTLMIILMIFIVRALYQIRRKNKKIALQSLRREMNPHFIFNSLNSVNQFIAQNNELEANKYLTSYSKLMRNIMENSNKDFITLSTELEQLREYLDLEHMRFRDKFDYRIDVDPAIDSDQTIIPNMLIQPQLENAIWHGLRYRDCGGTLLLRVSQTEGMVVVTIEDNGIGLRRSEELKTKHQREHKSRGTNNTKERISLLNSLYSTSINIEVSEKTEPETGVVVTLTIPLKDRKTYESNNENK